MDHKTAKQKEDCELKQRGDGDNRQGMKYKKSKAKKTPKTEIRRHGPAKDDLFKRRHKDFLISADEDSTQTTEEGRTITKNKQAQKKHKSNNDGDANAAKEQSVPSDEEPEVSRLCKRKKINLIVQPQNNYFRCGLLMHTYINQEI